MVDLVPRGPVYSGDAENPYRDVTDQYEDKMREWRDDAYKEAVRFRRMCPEDNRVRVYQKYIEGDQWELYGRRAKFRSSFYINKTNTARINHLATLTDTRPDIEVTTKIKEARQQAEAVDSIIRKEWQNEDMDLSLVTAADIAAVTGTAFWKIGCSHPGISKIIPCGPDMVMPIQPSFHIQDSTAVLYKTYKSLSWAVSKFPQFADRLNKEGKTFGPFEDSQYVKPDHLDQWTWQSMAPQFKRLLSRSIAPNTPVNNGMFRSVEVQEYYVDDLNINASSKRILMKDPYLSTKAHNWWYWVEPGERLYPRKRLVVFIGGLVVYDGPSPYWHGLYPFSTLRLNPAHWMFWGLSKYRDMIPVNSAINEIVAGVLDLIKQSLNPTIIAKTTSISKSAWDQYFPGMPGAKIAITNPLGNAAQDIQFSQAPQLPAYVFQVLAQYLGPEFDKLAGLVDLNQLYGKKQVPGGDTIEQMRDSQQGGYRLEGRFIETFLRDAGLQAVSNIFQFYTSKRRLELVGGVGITQQDFDRDAGTMIPASMNDQERFDYWKNFPINVVPGSMHGGARDRHKLLMINLFQLGAIGRQKLLKELEIVDDTSDEQLQQELMARMGGGSAARMSRGQRNGSPV